MQTQAKETNKQNKKLYINEQQVAEMTGISLSKLRNDRFKGRGLIYHKIDKSVRYKVSEVYEFMEARKVLPRI